MRVTHLNYCSKARRHLISAASTAEIDPIGAYVLVYDAARKAYDSHPRPIQNLRSTSRGGHIALVDVAKAQLDPPMGEVDQQLRSHAFSTQRLGIQVI